MLAKKKWRPFANEKQSGQILEGLMWRRKPTDSRLPGWGVTERRPQRPRLPALPSRGAHHSRADRNAVRDLPPEGTSLVLFSTWERGCQRESGKRSGLSTKIHTGSSLRTFSFPNAGLVRSLPAFQGLSGYTASEGSWSGASWLAAPSSSACSHL